jgi:AraC-like DNA-binding protein
MLLLILRYNLGKESISTMVTIYLYMNIGFMLIVPVIQLFVYGILILKSYRKHLNEIENYFSNTDEAKMLWIRWFIGVFIVYLIIFNVVNYSFQESWAIMDVLYYTDLFMFIGFLGIFGLKQADIYRMVSNPSNEVAEPETNEILTTQPALTDIPEGPSNPNTGNAPFVLGFDKKEQIKQLLLAVMEEQKPYLNPMLTITELAELLNSNQKYLSVVINDCFNKNFFTFINEYRVKEAIKLLSTSVGQQYSIEGIGKSVGFNSRSTFISAFKKQTNTTPSEYKNL